VNLKLREIAGIVSGRISGGREAEELEISGVSTDSRTISPGELFVALMGERFDGHDFVRDAASKGAVAAIVSRDVICPDGFPIISVDDTLRALGDLAAGWRRGFNPTVVAVTGSNGKTTVKEMLSSILSLSHSILKSEGNLNNLIGVPLTLLRLTGEHLYVVLELGTSRFGEISRLSEISSPQVGVITNIGPSHLQFFGDLDGVAREKGELLRFVQTAVLNVDDPFTPRLRDRARGDVFTFGLSERADVRAEEVEFTGEGMRFSISIRGERIGQVRLSALGTHNVLNALASACAAWSIGIKPREIIDGLNRFTPPHMRSELIELEGGITLINDAYNSNPRSLEAAIEILIKIGDGRRKVIVLGDMLELGEREDELHRQAGGMILKADPDIVITVGERSKLIAELPLKFGKPTLHFNTSEEASSRVCDLIEPGDVVLLKASRAMRFEKILEAIRERRCSTTSSSKS